MALQPSPEMGMATRHAPSDDHSGLSPSFQPVVRPCISTGRSSPSTGVQACCCVHGCLHHRLGCHVQWACSFSGIWMGPQLHWPINCLELLIVCLAMVLLRMDNTVTIVYINSYTPVVCCNLPAMSSYGVRSI